MQNRIGKRMFESLVLKYESEVAEAEATLMVYMENAVGIGEHPQHTEEMDNLVTQLTDAKDKLETITNFKIYEL